MVKKHSNQLLVSSGAGFPTLAQALQHFLGAAATFYKSSSLWEYGFVMK